MTTSCRWHTAWSSLSSVVLVFVLLLQSVQSYEFADIDDYFDTLVDVVPVGLQNDTEFPGRKLDISRVKRKLDQYDRQVLLFEHNTHRRTTRPLASNMAFMVWNLKLQLAALTVVDSCNETNELSQDAKDDIRQWFSNAGINTYSENAKYKFLIGNVVHKWTEEKSDYVFSRNTCTLGKMCDRYIQVIWATASHVGCELNFCESFYTTARAERHNLYYVACVYGEGKTRTDEEGKYLKPFTNGTQCENCPTGFAGCSEGLCQTEPPCETVVDCTDITDTTYCLCDKSTYDHGHMLTTFHWTSMGILLTGAILSSLLQS